MSVECCALGDHTLLDRLRGPDHLHETDEHEDAAPAREDVPISIERELIPGLGDAVLAHIRQEDTSLASIALHRKVEAFSEAQTGFAPGSFDIDPKGKVAADFDAIRGPARTAWARLAGYPLGDTISDGDVYNGMEAAMRWLATIPCSQISGGQV